MAAEDPFYSVLLIIRSAVVFLRFVRLPTHYLYMGLINQKHHLSVLVVLKLTRRCTLKQFTHYLVRDK